MERCEGEALVAQGADAVVAVIARLEERIAAQDVVIAELRARLGQNSRNSSRPPSSEGYSKPQPRSLRTRSGRRPGGQPGSEGRHLMRSEAPDETVVHAVERCDGCGGGLADGELVGSESRQVVDLPEMPRLRVTEHWVQRRRCGCCGRLCASGFPAEARAPVCYGPRIRALSIYLVCHQHLPYERAAQLMSDWLGAPVSVGSLHAFVREGAEGLEGFLAELRGQLQGAAVAHFDETGARADGRLDWVHSASTQGLTLLAVHARRGTDGIDAAGVLEGFAGTAVHDGWAPYRAYERATHALCNAHHLRELVGAAEQPGQGWASAMSCLLLDAKALVDEARTAGRDRLAQSELAALDQSYREVIALGHEANPTLGDGARGRRPKRTKAQNLLLRLDAHEGDVLRFAHDFQVPFDNNLAERDLRMVKLQQKISGCWRTRDGARRFLAIRSYLSTARKQGHRPLEALIELTAGQAWMPAQAPT